MKKRQLVADEFIKMLIKKAVEKHKECEPEWEHGEILEHDVISGDTETYIDITYEDFSVYRYGEVDGEIKYRKMR